MPLGAWVEAGAETTRPLSEENIQKPDTGWSISIPATSTISARSARGSREALALRDPACREGSV
jgi:hypothetical protein